MDMDTFDDEYNTSPSEDMNLHWMMGAGGRTLDAVQELDDEMKETEALVQELCQQNKKVNEECDILFDASANIGVDNTDVETALKDLDLADEEINRLRDEIKHGFNAKVDNMQHRMTSSSKAVHDLDAIMTSLLANNAMTRGKEEDIDFDKLNSMEEEQVNQILDVPTSYECTLDLDAERSLTPILDQSLFVDEINIIKEQEPLGGVSFEDK